MGFWAGILIGLVIGMMIGACGGLLVAALCHAAAVGRREDVE